MKNSTDAIPAELDFWPEQNDSIDPSVVDILDDIALFNQQREEA